mgnify:CR=1 FL=1
MYCLLAKHFVAQAFSMLNGSPPASQIHANVQALSGSPANLAIYTALLKYGDRMLTLNLSHGGHLSHGSPFNVSGKLYNVTQYSIRDHTRKLDYDDIHRQAQETKPAIIVGGASAYPWDWDWKRLRDIADDVGAYLHADVCHLAGLVVGGQVSNPLKYADTVMFTTHKTLMGPRGAVIVSKDPTIARKIDNAVFPGMQVSHTVHRQIGHGWGGKHQPASWLCVCASVCVCVYVHVCVRVCVGHSKMGAHHTDTRTNAHAHALILSLSLSLSLSPGRAAHEQHRRNRAHV